MVWTYNNKQTTDITHFQRGFTLIEMALVLAILGIIGVIYLEAGIAVTNQTNHQETLTEIENIQSAINDFAVRSHRLPCPADFDADIGTIYYGEEESSTTSSTLECDPTDVASPSTDTWGTVPWHTFGFLEDEITDPWGTRYRYVVNLNTASLSQDGTDAFRSPCNTANFNGSPNDKCTKFSMGGLDFRYVPYGGGKFLDMLSDYSIEAENIGGATITSHIGYAIISAGPNRQFEQTNALHKFTVDEKCYENTACPVSDVFDDIVVSVPIVSVIKATNHMPLEIDDE